MTVTSMTSFVEAKNKKEEERAKQWKRWQYRYLGGRVHIAYQDHSCDRCIFPISPGEQYLRNTFANFFRIKIEKSHWPCCYGPSEDDIREIEAELERQREKERQETLEKEKQAA
jgi:hypothetical protein